MAMIEIDHHPSRRQLNVFGVLWLIFFGFFGVMLHQTGSTTWATVLWCAAAVVPMIGWLVPEFMRLVFIGMAYAALPIGMVVSFLILAVVYYLILTPIGLIMRLLGHDPMNRRFDRDAESYWCAREEQPPTSSYFRQF